MSRNKKNLKMQMLEKLDSLNRIGEKKNKEAAVATELAEYIRYRP